MGSRPRPLRDGDLYFFVDEAGDSTFYNRRGKLIVGQPGCSKYLMLGFIRLYDPASVRRRITDFHKEVLSNPEFQRFSSLQSHLAFHASKDPPPVRDLFLKLISDFYFRAVFIVSQKDERHFR